MRYRVTVEALDDEGNATPWFDETYDYAAWDTTQGLCRNYEDGTIGPNEFIRTELRAWSGSPSWEDFKCDLDQPARSNYLVPGMRGAEDALVFLDGELTGTIIFARRDDDNPAEGYVVQLQREGEGWTPVIRRGVVTFGSRRERDEEKEA